jgi:hypothetical protein
MKLPIPIKIHGPKYMQEYNKITATRERITPLQCAQTQYLPLEKY